MKKRSEKYSGNKFIKGTVMSLCPLMAMYLGVSVYFMSHFYFGSTINCINVAGKTVSEADDTISSEFATYSLKINGRDGVNAEIKGEDIGLKYDSQGKIKEAKKSQSALGWISSIFSKDDMQIKQLVSFDEDLLKNQLNKSSLNDKKNITEPENASFKYGDNGYEIVDEVKGNKIDSDKLYEKVSEAVLDGEKTIDLDTEGCYEEPKYSKDSPETIEAKQTLDKYTNLKVTYNFGDREEVVDGDKINEWLDVDNDMKITFNESKVRAYVESLARDYNTFGANRSFHTSSGNTMTVSGGNYGWIIDKSAEVTDLINTIKDGQDAAKEPKYSQTAVSRNKDDIGDTYVEIDMTRQHIWYYKSGSLIAEGDVVTGNASNNWSTPVGTYRLNYKEKNATLKGENYASDVTYWMPFNNNIGIHDASWRSEFGGSIYLTNGSHGCVNAPYSVAEKIFQNIESGTPIVCYYEK